jgi:hypothetical protein
LIAARQRMVADAGVVAGGQVRRRSGAPCGAAART